MFLEKRSGNEWIVCEEKVEKEKRGYWETLFTLGNGYLGSRGALEERIEHSGTYLAGIYDNERIVNSPNPICLDIWVEGSKLDIDQVLEHKRALDMRRGLLLRHTVFKQNKRRFDYRSKRFFSPVNRHLGGILATFKSLDKDVEVVVRSKIEGKGKKDLFGRPLNQYFVTEVGEKGGLLYLVANTSELGIELCFATSLEILDGDKPVGTLSFSFDSETSVAEVRFIAKKGKSYRINKLISIFTSKDTKSAKRACLGALENRKPSSLLRSHQDAWKRKWNNFDIEVKGDKDVQRSIRFCLYHLLIAAPPKRIDTSIAPNTLTGDTYQGHIFWDTEIYMLPFFIYSWPSKAKDLILYRYKRLGNARLAAKERRYAGSLWPWESAQDGREATPDWWVNFDGSKMKVWTKEREHHISGDLVYAIALYYQFTKDEKFILEQGAEIVFETARFWASRVTRNAKSKKYEIRDVIGPNEFQKKVDNNFYTNFLAGWVLKYAHTLFHFIKQKHPSKFEAIVEKIGLSDREPKRWKEISERLKLNISSSGLIEEFDEYFKRKDVVIKERNESGMPLWPAGVRLEDVGKTQLVKQADVVLGLCLFSNEFSLQAKKINFEYYEPRTIHKSSLSIPTYALIAIEIGEIEKAYRYLQLLANSDLSNLFGNTSRGIHGASLGGTWQVVVRGFGGVKSKEEKLSINPSLPRAWQKLKFRFWWHGHNFEIAISKEKVRVFLRTKTKDVRLPIEIYNHTYYIKSGETLTIER